MITEYISKNLLLAKLNMMGLHLPEYCLPGISAVTEEVYKMPSYMQKIHITTNADRIRAMTDEELAEMLCNGTCKYCHSYNKDCDTLEWLKKEVEE